jgi:outer membrane protein TolC
MDGHSLAGLVEARLKLGLEYRKAVLEENRRGVRESRDLLESNEALLEAEADLALAKGTAWGVWAELEGFGKEN